MLRRSTPATWCRWFAAPRRSKQGTIGFIKLGEALGRSPKALMRMFSAKGNPQAKNLFEIVSYLQKIEGTRLEVVSRAA